MPKLHILTLSWEGKNKLIKLYPTLINSLKDVPYNFLIKDNGSSDSSYLLNEEWNNPNVNVIKYPHNKDNFAQGCNFLFKEASPKPDDYIMLLNNDVIFNDQSSIKNMIAIMEKDKDVGLVGARLLYKENQLQHAGVVFSQLTHRLPTHYRANQIADDQSVKDREFQAVTGAVWLTRVNIYENICRSNNDNLHGLNNKHIWCFEDIDGALSIKYNLNKKVVYCGHTNIFHEESATLKTNPINKLFLSHNINLLLKTWKGRYIMDRELYLTDPNYNLYKAPK